MLLSRGNSGRLPAAEVDRVEVVAHLSLVIAHVLGVAEAQLSREILPEALHIPVVEKDAPIISSIFVF